MNKLLAFLKKRKYLSVIIIIVLIVGGYYWYNKSKSGTVSVQYKTAVVEKGTITTSISGSGNVIVDQSSTVDPTITGTVANLAVNIGDKVTKGQFLFDIVNNQLDVSVSQAQSSYQSALSSFESAYSTKKSAEASYIDTKKTSTSTHSDKVAAKEKVDAADAGIESAQKSVNSTLENLNYQKQQAALRHVISPIAGTVNAVNVKNGDDLSRVSGTSANAQAPIIIGDLSTLKAYVQVNEVDIPSVSIGQKAILTFNAIEGFSATGKVEKMDSLGTLTSGVVTYNVTVGFDSLDPRIKPEMNVSAAIVTGVKQDVLLVPNSAVKTQNGNTYVQVLVNGMPENKTLEIGLSNDTQTEIVSGINAGDNVVTQTITSGASSTTTTSGQGGGGLRVPGFGGGGRGFGG